MYEGMLSFPRLARATYVDVSQWSVAPFLHFRRIFTCVRSYSRESPVSTERRPLLPPNVQLTIRHLLQLIPHHT